MVTNNSNASKGKSPKGSIKFTTSPQFSINADHSGSSDHAESSANTKPDRLVIDSNKLANISQTLLKVEHQASLAAACLGFIKWLGGMVRNKNTSPEALVDSFNSEVKDVRDTVAGVTTVASVSTGIFNALSGFTPLAAACKYSGLSWIWGNLGHPALSWLNSILEGLGRFGRFFQPWR